MQQLPIDTESFEKMRAANKSVWVIGLSFDSKTHLLAGHCVERFG